MLAFSVRTLRAGSAISEAEEREHEAGAAGDEERVPPAVAGLDEAADEIAERRRRRASRRRSTASARPCFSGAVMSSMIVGASVA